MFGFGKKSDPRGGFFSSHLEAPAANKTKSNDVEKKAPVQSYIQQR